MGQILDSIKYPETMERQLINEVKYKLHLEDINKSNQATPELQLAGVLGFFAIKPITLVNQGKSMQYSSTVAEGGPQTILNLTNMRIIGLPRFLKALIGQLSYTEALGPGRVPRLSSDTFKPISLAKSELQGLSPSLTSLMP